MNHPRNAGHEQAHQWNPRLGICSGVQISPDLKGWWSDGRQTGSFDLQTALVREGKARHQFVIKSRLFWGVFSGSKFGKAKQAKGFKSLT